MAQRSGRQKIKSFFSFLSILLLLPYIMTVFINGVNLEVIGMGAGPYVKAERTDQNGEEEVQTVAWKEYFSGVLAKTIPITYEIEAIKAQAVVLRTSFFQKMEQSQEEVIFTENWFSAEELEKKWGPDRFGEYYEKLIQAVNETEDQVLRYQEAYAWTPFHMSSNGMTRSGNEVMGTEQFPYLKVKECESDKEAEDEMQVTTYTYEEVKKCCQPFLTAVQGEEEAKKDLKFEDFEIKTKDSAGYVLELRIGDSFCTGDQFRDALSLPSSSFTLQDDGGKLKITTMGNGHGLGMSQWTAGKMAEEGKTYEEILQYFFEGTAIGEAKEIFQNLE